MPRGDRTGPAGEGAMTGRRNGLCAGFTAGGYVNAPLGRRFGGGRGGGFRGRFSTFFNNPRNPQSRAGQNLPDNMQSELALIRQRLDKLEKGPAGK